MKNFPKVGIVVPTIRESSIQRFLNEWKAEFVNYPNLLIFVIEDNPEKSFNLEGTNIAHLCWKDIEKDLGEKSRIIPRRTDCVRSYGYYKAYKEGVDIMITLDDDCYPVTQTPYLIENYIKNFGIKVSTDMFNPLEGRILNHNNFYPRGYPYLSRDREVVLNHGLWNNVPDFDGKTQLLNPNVRISVSGSDISVVPKNVFFTMCGMNLAVRRQAIPAFYFLLMGKDRDGKDFGIDRFGDIWCGFFIKKIIDHLNKAAVSGNPVVFHDRASNAEINEKKEAPGLPVNELLWKEVGKINLTGNNFRDCYVELAEKLPSLNDYFIKLKEAMALWASLFD
jgi:hypothetical protein